MTTTTYYNLNIAEGTDIVNPLTVDNPNYQKIDETMHDNAVAGVTLASELTNATIHALTRENSDCSVIRFIATSRWKAGDSVTVDGVPVLALLPSGETLPDGAYVINANVLCVLTGTNLTVYVGKSATDANEIAYNDTNVEEALNSLNNSLVSVNTNLSEVNSTVSTLTTSLEEVTSNLSVLSGHLINGDSTCDYVLFGKTVNMDFNFMDAIESEQFINLPASLIPKSDVTRTFLVRYSSSMETANITLVIGADGYIKLRNGNAYRGTGHITYAL